ncbi:site-2 protease family protein [Candidatus Micrarchaeota archaeon]|nr:site-2 protease family protein [Candidatus Micrarchaeota archaeon]
MQQAFYLEQEEVAQMVISVIAISLALAIVFATPEGLFANPREFFVFMVPLIVTIGSGFVLHEMAHKLIAIYYGGKARFRMWTQGIVFMLITSLFGFLFAAPGAVYINAKRITERENGLISLAGPALNLILVFFFLGLEAVAPIEQYYSLLLKWGALSIDIGIQNGVFNVWQFGAAINLLLALFNTIPAFPLDGSKIFRWRKSVWLSFTAVTLIIGYAIIGPTIILNWIILLLIVFIFSKLAFG